MTRFREFMARCIRCGAEFPCRNFGTIVCPSCEGKSPAEILVPMQEAIARLRDELQTEKYHCEQARMENRELRGMLNARGMESYKDAIQRLRYRARFIHISFKDYIGERICNGCGASVRFSTLENELICPVCLPDCWIESLLKR